MGRGCPLILALATLALACGDQPATAPGPAATGTPAPNHALIALADEQGGTDTLRLITVDGREVAHTELPRGASPIGAGGDMVTFVEGERLEALHASGGVDAVAQLPGYRGSPIVLRPDGGQWLWTAISISPSSMASRLVLSTRGGADRTVAQQTATTEPRVLQAFRWTPAGPVYEDAASGLGGYYLFTFSTGPSWRLDPGTGLAPPLLGDGCRVADLAADGTTACFQHRAQSFGSPTSLTVTWPSGRQLNVNLPRPQFTQAGAVSFKPGHAAGMLAIGGATGEGADTGRERYETDLVDLGTGALRRFGPAGLRPADGSWAWLADGSLICYRPPGALGGDPGVYVVAPDGRARRVFPSGTPIGVITA